MQELTAEEVAEVRKALRDRKRKLQGIGVGVYAEKYAEEIRTIGRILRKLA